MATTAVREQLNRRLDRLAPEQQWRVLGFLEGLSVSAPRGVPGRDLLRFAGMIPPDDLALMVEAIEQECERVDGDEW